MECYICRRTRDDFEPIFRGDTSRIDRAIERLDTRVLKFKSEYEQARKRYIDSKAEVGGIGGDLANLKITTIKADYEAFRRLNPAISLVVDYFDTFSPAHVVTIRQVIDLISLGDRPQ